MGKIIRRIELKKRVPTSRGLGNDLITMHIETLFGRISLPDRAITYQEFRAKAEIGSDVPIDASIAIYGIGMLPKPLHRDELEKLSDPDNPYFRKKAREALSASSRYERYFPIRLLTFTVAEGDRKLVEGKKNIPIPNTSGRGYLDEDEEHIKDFVKAVATLTKTAEFDVLTIPLISFDVNVLKRIYKWIIEDRRSFGFSDIVPTFSLRMRTVDLKELMDYISSLDKPSRQEDKKINLVAMQYIRSLNRMAQMYGVSTLFAERNIATIVMDVERQIINKDNLSGIHTQAHILGQSFSVNRSIKFPSEEQELQIEAPLWEGIKFLNASLLGLEGVYTGMTEKRFSELLSELELFFGDDAWIQTQILKEFRKRFLDRTTNEISEEDHAIIKYVRHLSRIHEFILSRREFASLRASITNEGVENYINSKKLLYPVLYASE